MVMKMQKELLEKLSKITPEVKRILAGDTAVDYSIYSSRSSELMDRYNCCLRGIRSACVPTRALSIFHRTSTTILN